MQESRDHHKIPMTSVSSGSGEEVGEDIYYYTDQIVNVIFVGSPHKGPWFLIDAGMPGSGKELIAVAEQRFGTDTSPQAILLTHGHFDHVGALVPLLEKWRVPVFAHPREFPFLTGEQAYPEPDPTVEGGLLAKLSGIYPHEPIDVSEMLLPLPDDQTVPGMEGWKSIPTPGHTPGQVAFFRERDRLLIAGDAFITVRQDSLYKVLLQKREINGPPRYLTTDWQQAWESVRILEALQPDTVITGHGQWMGGETLKRGLKQLVDEFDKRAIPRHGKYV